MQIPAIILAAGASSRLGQPKQMVLFNGETLLKRAIEAARQAGAAPIIVVLGAAIEAIRDSLSIGGVTIVENSRWHEGISTSIQAGLDALACKVPDAPGVLLMVCDQPKLTSAHLSLLVASFSNAEASTIVASSYQNTLGVPAIFPRSMFPALNGLRGDTGARALLTNRDAAVLAVPFEGGGVDVDRPQDLDELL